VALPVYIGGSHMASNGVPFTPILGVDSELNLGLLPDRQLYAYLNGNFWGQHSGPVPNQGGFDFSKREIDSQLGLAWGVVDWLELRTSLYTLDNLNRGFSLSEPAGGKQGIALEARHYLATANPYDVGRAGYIGVGYVPAGDLVGGNGASFRPGLFADAYLTRGLLIPWLQSYVYTGLRVTARQASALRLFETDSGWAFRPFRYWRNLEFRVGDDLTADVESNATRNLVYGAVRLEFGPRGFAGLAP
jgi:hypothetical protein